MGLRTPKRGSAVHQVMHVPADIKHLHEVAEKGDAPETPAILVAEVLVVLIPLLIVLLALTLGLYFAFGGP
jgi:hypothetical protein